LTRKEVNVLSFVPLWFEKNYEKGGGGWVRFGKIHGIAPKENINYHLTKAEFSLHRPLLLGTLQLFGSMVTALFQSLRTIRQKNIHLILSAVELPQVIVLSYLTSRIAGRSLAAFLNSVPCYGLIGFGVSKEKNVKPTFKSLLAGMKSPRKPIYRAVLESLSWYVTYKVLESSSVHIVCVSPVVADELSKRGLKDRIISIYPGNGIDYMEMSSAVPKVDIKKYDAIYAAGSFHQQKGVFDAVKIWRNVVNWNPKAKLAIAGMVHNGSSFVVDELNSLIKSLNLQQNVSIVCDPYRGFPQQELWAELKKSKILLYPSRKDVWPLIVGEALACGLPVIVYDLSGNKYAYGDCPAVCLQNVGDVEGAAKTMIRLLSDDSLLRNLSHKARQYAENHSWTHVVELERKAYLAILES